MKKITASRISDGNKLFPASITIDSTGLRVKIPGFWRNEETFVSYHDISAVSIDMPMISGVTGFATISFNAMGAPVEAHGFTKSEVNEIKSAIEKGKRKPRGSESGAPQKQIIKPRKTAEEIKAEAEVDRMERDEKVAQPWKFQINFSSADSIAKINIPDNPDDIEKTILRIIKEAVESIKKVIQMSHQEYQQHSMYDPKAIWSPLHSEVRLAETCIEKATEGLRKMRRYEGQVHPAAMQDCEDALNDLKNNWMVKLLDKQKVKSRQNKIMYVGLVVAVVAFFVWASIASD
ncbi:MAG: hypothetical protein K9G41_12320 [Flavobacteriales bacterium]|nr:hypothetical protein [Flavobacteriales bacterium]